jgi:hypothetical protein
MKIQKNYRNHFLTNQLFLHQGIDQVKSLREEIHNRALEEFEVDAAHILQDRINNIENR